MKRTIEAATELTVSYIKLLIESCQMKVVCGCDSGIMCEHGVCKDKNVKTSLCIDRSVLPIFLPANVKVKMQYSFHVSFYMEDRHKSAEIHYCIVKFSSNRQAIYDFVRQISGNIWHK
jgi:hypothetical protein